MIELRWQDDGVDVILQQRTRLPIYNESGAICGFGEWSEWTNVETAKVW